MRQAILGLACLVAASVAAHAQSNAPSLITPTQLEPMLADRALVLLHVGDKAEYDAEHLPGARHIEVRSLAATPQQGGLTLQLPIPAELETKLEALGISDTSRIVVYMGKDWISPLTRVVFTLDYAGLGGRTMVLDGGMQAWKAAGKAVVTDVPAAPATGTLTIKARPEAVADLAWVQSHAGKSDCVVIDARNTQFYTGESNNNGRIPRPGHVAGAVSAPFDTWVREDGSFKPRAELEAMLKAAGARTGTTVATYCHIGQQATVPYFVARMLGYDVKLFDGSYEEWSRTESAPVKTGSAPQ
ncbi:Thiosulfate sulfurtransferase [Luteitalea pratensis]|uniref:Thiosulfate sulfurtransferase n=1 Tax=Luteitalea pratensis TaxID=1855912 RepID=A0A143PVU3_LUTPR|nr:rhodanese-like domain-containing protein [Luteitalea pratensis]AMY12877.1 Thiosulfate sulfurtransferase [Luteitalea pratensis]